MPGSSSSLRITAKSSPGSWIATNFLPGRKDIDATPDEYSHDQLEWKLGKDWVAAHLANLPLLTVYKIGRFWLPDWSSRNTKFVLMQFVAYSPMGILILLGLYVSLRPIQKAATPPWLAVHGILLTDLVATIVFYGSARFRDSITPVLMIYAALGLERVVSWWTRKGVRKAVA